MKLKIKSLISKPIAVLIAALLVLGTPALAMDAGRDENPVQLQFNPAFGGVNIGYHISKTFYIGVVQGNTFSYSDNNSEYSNDENTRTEFDQSGATTSAGVYSQRKAVELRITPFAVGFYISAGYLTHEADEIEYSFDTRSRYIGSNYYTTGFDAKIVGEAYQSTTIGLGFNHVTKFGLSFGAGLMGGTSTERKHTVTLSSFDVDVAAADKQALEDRILKDFDGTGSGMLHAGIGYNF